MQILTRLIVAVLVFCLALSSPAFAQDRHTVDPAALAGAVAQHAAEQDADRAAIHEALGRPEVSEVAAKGGLDLNRAIAAADTMNGQDLEHAASLARDVNQVLVGGANSVTLSTTTIIIILLLVILLIVAVK